MNVNKIRRLLSLGILFFSTTGFHLLPFRGAILAWFILIFILNIGKLRLIIWKDFYKVLLLCISILALYNIKGGETPFFIPIVILSSYIVLLNYKYNKDFFLVDFSNLLKYYSYYTIVSFIILLFFYKYLWTMESVDPWFKSFFGLFWYIDSGGPAFLDKCRLCGLAWEPGVWQSFMNFNLFFALMEKRSKIKLTLAFLSVLLTFSTTGIFLMCIVIVYYLFVVGKIKITGLITIGVLFFCFWGVLASNVTDKLYGKGATSSLVRYSDVFVGAKLLSIHPWLGVDPRSTLNSNDNIILSLKSKLWEDSEIAGDSQGFMNAEIINGFMIFFLDWGLPIGILLSYKLAKSDFIVDKKIYTGILLILTLTLFSEPVSRTTLLYIFIIGSFIFNDRKNNVGRRCYIQYKSN